MHERLSYDVVVVGGGPAGVAAACSAAGGGSVALLEASPWLGGQIWSGGAYAHQPRSAAAWFGKLRHSSVDVFLESRVIGAAGNTLMVDGASAALEIRYGKLILATGARELMVPFPGWTTPGVLGVGGLHNLAKLGWPVKGQRVAVAGSGPLLISVAAHLRKLGAKIVFLAEQADHGSMVRFAVKLPVTAPAKLVQGAAYASQLFGVPFKQHCWPTEVVGDESVTAVRFSNGSRAWEVGCDYLACAYGLVPNLELPRLFGLKVLNGAVQTNASLESAVPGIYCAGETTGVGGVDAALLEGQLAGGAAAGREKDAPRLAGKVHKGKVFEQQLDRAFALREELKGLARPDTILCRCEDVTVGQAAARQDWRETKLYHHMGMGPCQGRTCGAAVHFLFGWEPESVRPPVLPVTLGRLAEFGEESD